MDFSELFSFQGRANRAWYLGHILLDDFVIMLMVILMVVVGAVTGMPLIVFPMIGLIVGGVVAGLAVSVKRLHDLDMSGWHLLGMAVPLYNIYLGLKMAFVRGTLGPNQFGFDPLMPNQVIEEGPVDMFEIEGP